MSNDNILSDQDLQRIESANRETLGDTVIEPRVMRVGKIMPDGTIQVPVPNPEKPGLVWVRPQAPGSEPIPAVWVGEALRENRFVNVKWRGSQAYVDGFAIEDGEYMAFTTERPQTETDLSQFNVLLLRPSAPASMVAIVTAAPVTLNNVAYAIPNLLTKDFTADIPTVGLARYIMLEVNPVTNALTYTNGSAFSDGIGTIDGWADYAPKNLTGNHILIGWIRLYYGMAGIIETDIYAGQELISKNTSLDPETVFASVLFAEGKPVYAGSRFVLIG